MALDESLVEELGFGPVWRLRRAAGETSGEVLVDVRSEALSREGQIVARSRDLPVGRVERETEATPAGDARSRATPAPAGRDPNDARNTEAPPAEDAQLRATPAARSTIGHALNDAQATAAPPAEDAQPHTATVPRSPAERIPHATPATDTPPLEAYDDLPWADDEPAHAPLVASDALAADDIHTLDWNALETRVSSCERCKLCERRTNTVFGVGDREADWMLIGEAPGENEDKQGEPFVGQAGKLLDNMLRALSLTRESNVYIANVIKCRPPGNRNPEVEEVARCEPFLQRQVELVKPKVIVALGRFAAQSLLKSEASIASMRGRLHEYRGVPVVVTYHPAYLLRSLPDKSRAWADLCLARGAYRDALDKLGVQPSGAGATR